MRKVVTEDVVSTFVLYMAVETLNANIHCDR